MTAALKDLADTMAQLPAKERAFLAERLLASLEEADYEEDWMEEAKRRRDEVRSGTLKPIPSDEVYRRINRILKK